jgi:hypothetical protein
MRRVITMPPNNTPNPPRIKKNRAGGCQIVVPQRAAMSQKNQVQPCVKARKPHMDFLDKVDVVKVMSNLQF